MACVNIFTPSKVFLLTQSQTSWLPFSRPNTVNSDCGLQAYLRTLTKDHVPLTFLHDKQPPIHMHATSCVCCPSVCRPFPERTQLEVPSLDLMLFAPLTNNTRSSDRTAGLAGMKNLASQQVFFFQSWGFRCEGTLGTEVKGKEASLGGGRGDRWLVIPGKVREHLMDSTLGQSGGQAGLSSRSPSVCDSHSDSSEDGLQTVCVNMSLMERKKANDSF